MSVLSQPPRRIPARLIVAGDFTRFNGFRHVVSVKHEWSTQGRGSNRASHFTSVLLFRADGMADTVDPGAELSVHREWSS